MFKKLSLFSLLTIGSIWGTDQDVLHHIEADYAHGLLSRPQAVVLQLTALENEANLPQRYRADTLRFTRLATELRAEALSLMASADDAEKQLLQQALSRPELPLSLVSPSGRFRIHYSDTGIDAATIDFVRETAQAFDTAYHVEVETLGFNPPPADLNVDGPEFDVYIKQYGEYGATTPEQPVPETPQQDYTAWIIMDNDFMHTPTKGLDGMRVTAAHEFFHLVQFGYRAYHTTEHSSAFFYEATATWMEDMVYPNINDYYNYLPYFFSAPNQSFTTMNGNHEYGLGIFFHMLNQKYGVPFMRTIWDEMVNQEPLEAINSALLGYKSNLIMELGQFAIWNCYTGSRADTVNYYREGRRYPEITANESLNFSTQLSISGSLASLGCRYLHINAQTMGSNLLITPTFSDPYHALCAYVLTPSTSPSNDLLAGQVNKTIPVINERCDFWIIPISARIAYTTSKEITFQFTLDLGKPGQIRSQINLAYPNPFIWNGSNEITFDFQLSEQTTEAKAMILSEQGLPVETRTLGPLPMGWHTCSWDGRDQQDRPVPSGVYLFLLKTEHWQELYKFVFINAR